MKQYKGSELCKYSILLPVKLASHSLFTVSATTCHAFSLTVLFLQLISFVLDNTGYLSTSAMNFPSTFEYFPIAIRRGTFTNVIW